jgi:hypothetical protein
MACVSPPELNDRELLTYIDGEANQQVVAHLERCPHCCEKAHRLARLQHRLIAQLYRLTCPSSMELGEYDLGLLPREQAAAVARHLAECPHCIREVAQLRDYLTDLAPTLGLSPLERFREQIKVLVARLVSVGPGSGLLKQPALAPAYLGVRGEEEGSLVYQADDIQVVIEVHEDVDQPDRRVLLGLVTEIEPRELKVHLWQASQSIATVSVDELGNFAIPGLAPGSYELILSGPEVEIHIQALEI